MPNFEQRDVQIKSMACETEKNVLIYCNIDLKKTQYSVNNPLLLLSGKLQQNDPDDVKRLFSENVLISHLIFIYERQNNRRLV